MSVIKYKDSNGNYVKIPANVGINNVVEGYYNETDFKFYEESTYETEITAETNKIYISLDTDKSYYWDGSEYKLLSGGGGVSDFDDLTNRPQESDTIDIDDLDLPMPAKPTEYPVLFDETGTEYKVGLYKRASDGKVKPVYKKTWFLSNTTPVGPTGWTVLINGDNQIKAMEKILDCVIVFGVDTFYFLSIFVGVSSGNVEVKQIVNDGSTYNVPANSPISITYTKTTDEWKEV